MLTIALRFAGLAAAIALGLAAFSSWNTGAPPAWSFVAEKAQARVIESRVESGLISNGTMRHTPVVTVDHGAGPIALKGLEPSFFNHRQDGAAAIVADYTPGASVSVRMIDGVAMADRQDLFQTAHAAAMTLMALVVGVIGLVMFVAFSPEKPARREERA